jgi:hypothetical protein
VRFASGPLCLWEKNSLCLLNSRLSPSGRADSKKKVKSTLVQALRLCTGRTAYRGNRGIALLFHDHGTRRGEGSASHLGRSLPPGKTRYLLYGRLGGTQGQSGQVQKISPPPGFDPRTVQPVASRYTDYATRPTDVLEEKQIFCPCRKINHNTLGFQHVT